MKKIEKREKKSGWACEFRRQVKKLKRKSGEKWYNRSQPHIGELQKTGRGNCVAWSLLAKKIAIGMGLQVVVLDTKNIRDNRIWWSLHRTIIVFEKNGEVWQQSNIWFKPIERFRTSTRINFSRVWKTILSYLKQIKKRWRWKTLPQIDNLWYYYGSKVERIIMDGKRTRKPEKK